MLLRALASLDPRRRLLWGVFLWYAVVVTRYAPDGAGLWLRSAAIGLIVGGVLTVNALPPGAGLRALGGWAVFRFWLIPFCVSSLATIASERRFALIFPRDGWVNLRAVAVPAGFAALAWWARRRVRAAGEVND